jgi:trans-L-3-hydroxyproline dehydratase
MHTGGEPVRIVVEGYPEIPGATILAKRRYAREHLDRYRKMLMFEPRGHYDMYGVVPVAPDHPQADLAVLFMHNEGYSTMCGHATIAIGRWAIDTGLIRREEPETRFNLQVPCGLVHVRVEVHGETTGAVRFESVPAFAAALNRTVEVPGIGKLLLDVGYGGAFYALIPAHALELDLRHSPVATIVDRADRVTQAVKEQVPISHPDDPDLAFIYGTIVTDGADAFAEQPTRNVCVFAAREVDRSPTGSGVTARIAVQHAKGLIAIGQERKFESLTDAIFTGKAVAATRIDHFDAVTVEVGGRAHYTGTARYTVEPDDMLGGGFLLR